MCGRLPQQGAHEKPQTLERKEIQGSSKAVDLEALNQAVVQIQGNPILY